MIPGMYSRSLPPQPINYRYSYPMRSPLSFLSTGILLCGLIAVISVLAPDLLELRLPGWRERFGYLVTIGVALGLLRAVWRTMFPLIAVGFWVVALLCLWKPSLTEVFAHAVPSLSIPTLSARSENQPAKVIPASFTRHGRLGSAVPDDAYFAKPYTARSGAGFPTSLTQVKGSLGRMFGGL
jgi:hypothetical protein